MTKRFYENDPLVKQAVEAIFLFPYEIQSIIASGIADLAENECQVKAILEDVKSLGADVVLSIYKSKRRRRQYDGNPNLHQAINYLMVLPEDKRRLLAVKISELIELMGDYLKICRDHQADTQAEVVQAITTTYVKTGQKQCKLLLGQLEKEFRQKIQQMGMSDDQVTQEMKIRRTTGL